MWTHNWSNLLQEESSLFFNVVSILEGSNIVMVTLSNGYLYILQSIDVLIVKINFFNIHVK